MGLHAILMIFSQAGSLPAGIYTNEEDRYFAQETAQSEVPPWSAIEVANGGRWRKVDSFGSSLSDWHDAVSSPLPLRTDASGRIWLVLASGRETELRRGRPFTCWVAVRRDKDKPDGSADWTAGFNLPIHDQGGRVQAGGNGAPPVQLRMRHVEWPPETRRQPNLVLYIHRPDDPDRAVSYAWADGDARMVGINLRWMQGSCTRTEAGK